MPRAEAIEREVNDNYDAFVEQLPNLVRQYGEGRYLLMRDRRGIKAFESAGDAVRFGNAAFEDGLFSVQKVTNLALNQGFFSHGGAHADV